MIREEAGELFKTIRKDINLQIDNNSKVGSVDEEIIDVFIFLCAIANKFNHSIPRSSAAGSARSENSI